MSAETKLCPCCGRPLPRGALEDPEEGHGEDLNSGSGAGAELLCETVFSGGRVFTADELLEVLREDVGLDGQGDVMSQREHAEALRTCQRSLRQAMLELAKAVSQVELRATPGVQVLAADSRRALEWDTTAPENRLRAALTAAHGTLRELVERLRPVLSEASEPSGKEDQQNTPYSRLWNTLYLLTEEHLVNESLSMITDSLRPRKGSER